MKRFAIALCIVAIGMLTGCSQASEQATEVLDEAASTTTTADPDATAGNDPETDSSEMPEVDFGIDESAYLAETYGLESEDNLDLIGYDQLVWIAQNRGQAVVVVADASDEASAAIIAEAQKAAAEFDATVYVYEPARDSADDLTALSESLVQDGIVNLEGLETGTIITLSKLTTDATGQPAPVTGVITDVEDVYETVKDTYGITCCQF